MQVIRCAHKEAFKGAAGVNADPHALTPPHTHAPPHPHLPTILKWTERAAGALSLEN